jgi:exosortase A-associated hydrolase 1
MLNPGAGQERTFTFPCRGATLVGILHPSDQPAQRGILVVVGGPQYRVGSHRQFVLLARELAAQGVPVLRFDHRGIGDSDEPYLGFEALDHDIAAAVDAFMAQCPGLRDVILWGLCDAASAILFYAHQDPRIAGIVLLNPWVRTPQSEARAYLRHYYVQRLIDRDFWRNLLSGRFNLYRSAISLLGLVAQRLGIATRSVSRAANANIHDARPLPERMAHGLSRFKGPVLLIMCGRDLTAREFEDAVRASETWRRLLNEPRVSRRDLPAADHTFSRQIWRDRVLDWTCQWIRDS